MADPRYKVGDIVIPLHHYWDSHTLLMIHHIDPNWDKGEGLYYWTHTIDRVTWKNHGNNTSMKHFEEITMLATVGARILYGR